MHQTASEDGAPSGRATTGKKSPSLALLKTHVTPLKGGPLETEASTETGMNLVSLWVHSKKKGGAGVPSLYEPRATVETAGFPEKRQAPNSGPPGENIFREDDCSRREFKAGYD